MTAHYNSAPTTRRETLLRGLGAAVRARRTERGLTLKALARDAHVSERFLLQLEGGVGNISVARLLDVAEALGTSPSELLAQATNAPAPPPEGVVALLGLRGAGKTAVGERAAARLGVPLVELDALVAKEAGMSLSTIFEMHGEAYFRRVERQALKRFLDARPRAVLATSGSIVTDRETFAMLRRRAKTVWLRAEAKDHWDRVVAQGDGRPMKGRPAAMAELKELLRARKRLYARAEHVIDTSSVGLDAAAAKVAAVARGDSA